MDYIFCVEIVYTFKKIGFTLRYFNNYCNVQRIFCVEIDFYKNFNNSNM